MSEPEHNVSIRELDQSDLAWLRDAADLQEAFNTVGVLTLARSGLWLEVGVDGHTGYYARAYGCGEHVHSARTAGRAIRAALLWSRRHRQIPTSKTTSTMGAE